MKYLDNILKETRDQIWPGGSKWGKKGLRPNVWDEERGLTTLLLSRMEESETEQHKKEITSAAGFSGHIG